jgi:hypothetical protein
MFEYLTSHTSPQQIHLAPEPSRVAARDPHSALCDAVWCRQWMSWQACSPQYRNLVQSKSKHPLHSRRYKTSVVFSKEVPRDVRPSYHPALPRLTPSQYARNHA